MKKRIYAFFAMLTVASLMLVKADPSIVNTTYAYDKSGLFSLRMDYYDDDHYEVAMQYIVNYTKWDDEAGDYVVLPEVKDLVFPATVHAKFEKYDNPYTGKDIEDDFEYTIEENCLSSEAFKTVETITFEEGIKEIPNMFYAGPFEEVDEAYWDMYVDGDATVLREIHIPASVEQIGDKAFCSHMNLEQITFAGDGLLTIGADAFKAVAKKNVMYGTSTWYSKVSGLVLPSSLISIGDHAFQGLTELKEFTLDGHVSTLGESVFESCGIEELTLNKPGYASVSSSPFAGCPLKKVTIIPATLTDKVIILPDKMFAGINSPFDVVVEDIDADFEAIDFGVSCFDGAKIKSFTFPSKFVMSPGFPFSIRFQERSFFGTDNFKDMDLASVNCANAVQFGERSFYSSGLQNLTLNDKVSAFGNEAFAYSNIEALEIPQYINHLGDEDFIDFGDNVFYSAQQLESARIKSKIKYDGIENMLAPHTFERAMKLKTFELPANIEFLGAGALAQTAITEFTGTSALTSIQDYVFYDCPELKTVELSKTHLESIEPYVFAHTPKLETLALPATVLSIKGSAFEECGIKELEVYASDIEAEAFLNMPELTTLRFTDDGLTSLPTHAISGCPKLENVDFGHAKSLDKDFIYECESYRNVVISKELKSIDPDAFDNVLPQLKKVTLVSNNLSPVASPADGPFYGAEVEVIFDEELTQIPANFMAGVTVTNPLELREDLNIDEDAFTDAVINELDWHYGDGVKFPFLHSTITTMRFSKVNAIADEKFKGALINNLYLDGIETIGESAFEDADLANEARKYTLVIPASVKSIGTAAFKNIGSPCLLFEEGEGLTLGDEAFMNASGYTTITSYYPADNIPVAEENTFNLGGAKCGKVFFGDCDAVEAYKNALGWKKIDSDNWNGITPFKYSFEIVGEEVKRPIEMYYAGISINGMYLDYQNFITCDNQAELSFEGICPDVVFDHWEDGSTEKYKHKVTLTSDTVFRIYVKEHLTTLTLATKDPAMADQVVFKYYSVDEDKWIEGDVIKYNSCDMSQVTEISFGLKDPAHYSFYGWFKEDETLYNASVTASITPGIDMTLYADVRPIDYNLHVELMMEDPNFDLVDHLELNGVDYDKFIDEPVPYGSEVELKVVGDKGSDYRYVLDEWVDRYTLATYSENNPWIFTMGDENLELKPVMKEASKFDITATPNSSTLGDVKMDVDDDDVALDGKIWEQSPITLTATPKDHCQFVKWNDNELEQMRTIYASKDFDYVAEFEKDSFDIQVTIQGVDAKFVVVNGAGRYGWGDEVTLSYTILDDHYLFSAWSNETESTYKTDDSYTFKVEKNLSFIAQFEPQKYIITTEALPAEGGTVTGGGEAYYLNLITLKAEPNEGYEFTGWEDDGEAAAERKVLVEDNASYTAFFAKKQYEVKFVSEDKVFEVQNVEHGDKADVPMEEPTKEGYDFTGWSPDPTETVITGETTFTAQYKIKTFTVRFYDREGNLLDVQKVNWNEAAEAPADQEWEGHTFTGWSEDYEHVMSDLDIQPVFDVNLFTVTFVDWNDEVIQSGKVEYGKDAEAPADPVRDGYDFIGWDKEFDNITADLTVKAQYKEKPVPQNLKVDLVEDGDEVEITLSWDKLDGALTYELKVLNGEELLFSNNTFGKNSVTSKLSELKKEYSLKPGKYTINWAVRATDALGNPTTGWADGESFELTIKDTGTGVDNVQGNEVQCTKIMRNGTMYILRGEKMYDATGRLVK